MWLRGFLLLLNTIFLFFSLPVALETTVTVAEPQLLPWFILKRFTQAGVSK